MTTPTEQRPKYLLIPGYVQSANDTDWHYISGPELARLYGLKPEEYVIQHEGERPMGLIPLHPRVDGHYVVPE